MPKRKAPEAGGLAFEPIASKKLLVEDQSIPGLLEDDDDEFDDSTSYSEDTHKPGTAYTATTVVSNRSRKFPSDLKTIQCTYPGCEKTFNRPARLAAHLRSHTDDRPFKCTYDSCDKTYREEKHLRQHVKGSHTQERSYICTTDGCNKSFLTATRLRRHQDVHAGQERFRCRDYPPCNQSFRKHNTLQRHIRAEHQGGPAYICPEAGCNAGFDSQGALRNHTKREHSAPSFWCDECAEEVGLDGQPKQVGFTSALLLQTHIRKEHLNCIFCDQKCKGQGELEKHVELHHSGVPVEARKTIPCTWEGCDKKFTKRNNLNAHVRSAHEGFRFVCGEVDHTTTVELEVWSNELGCGAGFVTKANLEAHIKHIHLGIARPIPNFVPGNGAGVNGREGPSVQGPTTSVIDDITGVNRNIACAVPGCTERFIRHHDLQMHLATHADVSAPVSAPVINDATASVPAPPVAVPQLPDFLDLSDRAMPNLPFLGETQSVFYRPEPPLPQAEEPLLTPFLDDEHFWFGAGEDFGLDVPGGSAGADMSWQQDEAAMRSLIDEDFDRFVDPALGGGGMPE